MTKAQIQAQIALIEARYPGLRMSNRYEWTHKVAHACYLQDATVGQKRADAGRPISDDTIGWAASPVIGVPGQQVAVTFNAVDLLDGSTGAIHWDENPGITNQLFVIPLTTDIGTSPVPAPPPVVVQPYPGDAVWDAVGVQLFADYARAGQPPNPQMGRWFGRTIWDATEGDGTVLTVPESITKHRAEWCAVLGIAVTP